MIPGHRAVTAVLACVVAVLLLTACDPIVAAPGTGPGTTTSGTALPGATTPSTTTAGTTSTTPTSTTTGTAPTSTSPTTGTTSSTPPTSTTTTTATSTTTTTRTTTPTTTTPTTTTPTTTTPTTTAPPSPGVLRSGAPVFAQDFPDPAAVLVGGTYTAFATQSGAINVQRITSPDLRSWARTTPTDALEALPAWADNQGTWAPDVQQIGGRFVLFYTVHQRGGEECISAGVAASITDQFVDSSTGPLVCQTGGGSIDPSPYTDPATGAQYLSWKQNDSGAATLFSRRLNAAGTGFAAAPASVLLRSTGTTWTVGNIEGPTMVDTGHGWLLLYSGNVYWSTAYGIGYATCAGPLGPCTNASVTAPWVGSQGRAQGPGGQSLVVDAQGRLVMLYHAWDTVVGYDRGGTRALWADVLDVSTGVPRITS